MCDVFLKTKISGNLKTRKSHNHRAFGFYFIAHPSPVRVFFRYSAFSASGSASKSVMLFSTRMLYH